MMRNTLPSLASNDLLCAPRQPKRAASFGQFGKVPKCSHIPVLIVRLHGLENVKDFARYHAANKAARFILAVPFAEQTIKSFLGCRRIQLPNLVFDDLKDSVIQALVNLHPDLPIVRLYASLFGQIVKVHNVELTDGES